jgi:HD-GYP domain-containing protein (c-di-GMP phosphodiesterase class II)
LIQEGIDEIAKGRGTAFDPRVVDACLRLIRENNFQLRNHNSDARARDRTSLGSGSLQKD